MRIALPCDPHHKMCSEIATIVRLRQNTKIPVPTVFGAEQQQRHHHRDQQHPRDHREWTPHCSAAEEMENTPMANDYKLHCETQMMVEDFKRLEVHEETERDAGAK